MRLKTGGTKVSPVSFVRAICFFALFDIKIYFGYKYHLLKYIIIYDIDFNFKIGGKDMEKSKRTLVKSIVVVISLIMVYYVAVNAWYLIAEKSADGYNYTKLIKRIIPLLCTVMVLFIGNNGINRKDTLLLKISYLVICVAELFFTLDRFIPAVAFFGICQILLSIRHYQGIKEPIETGAIKRFIPGISAAGAAILILVALWLMLIFYPALKGSNKFYAILLYGLVLGVSLWIAVINYIAGTFPKKNALIIMLCMVLFFFSDFLVGIGVITNDLYNKSIIDMFVWITYAPTVTFIAISGYRLEGSLSANGSKKTAEILK
jgi:hypothetical protein